MCVNLYHFFHSVEIENNGKSSFVGLKCILNIISASRSKATLCSSLKSACLLERKSLSAEDVSCPRRQPDALRGWWVHWGGGGGLGVWGGGIKGGRMAPVAPTLHQCNYLTAGQRMEKKWQKLFCCCRRRRCWCYSFFLPYCIFLTLKSKLKKSPLPPLQRGGHVSTAAPSLSWLAVWMSAVFVMTRVQSGGKLEPRRTGNWQIVFCPARIIISNTQRLHAQRTSAANGVTRNLKDAPFITPASPNFTLSGILSDTRLESEKTPAAVSNRHQTCAVFFFLFFVLIACWAGDDV